MALRKFCRGSDSHLIVKDWCKTCKRYTKNPWIIDVIDPVFVDGECDQYVPVDDIDDD